MSGVILKTSLEDKLPRKISVTFTNDAVMHFSAKDPHSQWQNNQTILGLIRCRIVSLVEDL